MSTHTTIERIAELRAQAEQNRQTAKDSPRYEVYFAYQQRAKLLDGEADQLALETQSEA